MRIIGKRTAGWQIRLFFFRAWGLDVYCRRFKGTVEKRGLFAERGELAMDKETKEVEERTPSEPEDVADVESKELKMASKFDGIYSRVSSNRLENLRTTHIENKAKELARKSHR